MVRPNINPDQVLAYVRIAPMPAMVGLNDFSCINYYGPWIADCLPIVHVVISMLLVALMFVRRKAVTVTAIWSLLPGRT
jgi:hypothetical protein